MELLTMAMVALVELRVAVRVQLLTQLSALAEVVELVIPTLAVVGVLMDPVVLEETLAEVREGLQCLAVALQQQSGREEVEAVELYTTVLAQALPVAVDEEV